MGRQKGEGARSKARPSSSSLAASLLPSGSTAAVGFGGYVGSSRLDSSLAGDDAVPYLDIDSEVAVHLKRLSRKDPTTKLKALASLSALLKEKSRKDIVTIIPQWAFEYKRLLMDYNREVRRATHDTMTNLVTAVGRDLAPHLKILMGPWWFSQFDSVSEVSQVAKRSLQAAFPAPEKRLDALILCTTEIFLYLEENLKLTPKDMSDKAAALDEVEQMHNQVIASSLLALATLLDVLVGVQFERSSIENVAAQTKHASKARVAAISSTEKLFAAHNFFSDFLKSQSAVIRSATYSVLRSFIKNVPHVFNEGNMKTMAGIILGAFQEKDPACHSSMWDMILLFSKKFPDGWTSLNVQKTILNRFWHFLRNGCFGSQQVSYPALVLFLDCVPPNAVVGEKFFLEFFQNYWAGSSLSSVSTAGRLSYFGAFKECFLWALHNASRYYNGVDTLFHFRVTLIENVLVKILWRNYVTFICSNEQERVPFGLSQHSSKSSDLPLSMIVEASNIKYPIGYLQDLRNSIIDLLSGIFLLEPDLLSTFRMEFQDNCLGFFAVPLNKETATESVERVIQFIMLMGQHAVQKGESWPLVYLVGPTLAKSFPRIRAIDSPEGVKLLSVAVSVFGPRKIAQELFVHNKDLSLSPDDRVDRALEADEFMQIFRDTFVPWCLHGSDHSTSARLDLLLALLDDECFSEQWRVVIMNAISLEDSGTAFESLESDQVTILALLVEKARNEITKRKAGEDCRHWKGADSSNWRSELLDSVAVTLAYSPLSYGASNSQFLCAVLGGATEGDQISFVSTNASILIFEEILKKLLSFILESSFNWVRDACSMLTAWAVNSRLESKSSISRVEMANFALQVLDGSFFCLKSITEDSELVPGILAAVLVIGWEYGLRKSIDNAPDDNETNIESKARLEIGESFHVFCCKRSNQFRKSLGINNLERLGSILIQCIRSAIFSEYELNTENVTSLCCLWMLEFFSCFCQDQLEEQNLLDQLLCENDKWPLWIISDFSSSEQLLLRKTSVTAYESGHRKFVSFIDKLVMKLGIDKVFTRSIKHALSPSEETTHEEVAVRAWLAAELLCTWKWPGGSVLDSFLPLLSTYAKNSTFPSKESLLDSIFNILLDGALVHGGCGGLSFVGPWPASNEEIEHIEEPFLRALVTFLSTLFKENVWEACNAIKLFELVVNKLYIGEAININCLRILPWLVNVLVQPLFESRSCDGSDAQNNMPWENHIQDIITGWLQKTLLFPPLIMSETGQGVEDWLQLVISCFPFYAKGGIQGLNLGRIISPLERMLLLELFRKQRYGVGTSNIANMSPGVQLLLSKLIAVSVGYCWKEFTEEDWEHVLSQLRRWIQSAVVITEELAENVDDSVTNNFSVDNLEDSLKKLEQIASISDSFPIDIAKNALLSFSLCCGSFGNKQLENAENINPLGTDRWDPIKDRILEGILRLFFCTGIAEAIASSFCHEAASIISSSRFEHLYFWELVASSVVNSSANARDRAVKSVEFWGLSKGPISSLYAVLFSSKPVPLLQFAAYVILSTEPVSNVAIFEDNTNLDGNINNEEDSRSIDLSMETSVYLKKEIACMIEKFPHDVFEMDLMAQQRVNVFLAWSLLLSNLWSLPSSSPARERLVQYIQNFATPVVLDCIFQHIPVDLCISQNLKKKDVELPAGLSEAAIAANLAITNGSSLFSTESLWPVEPVKLASLAGALFGLMLRVLPAYVREWFSGLRDRSMSTLIESFTRTWCSPPLIANELSQIKKNKFSDDNFSVSISKSANEAVATYTKDETGMDLVIRLPASYPLRPVDVDCTRSLGISDVKKRKWLMSMMSFVRNQNGALAEAIGIWKRNFDKEFEGVEECPICYSVIHTANNSLPRLACKTCKHKFHSACLYKWFSTSHKSTCPLCQSPF
ncbi:Vacuolar protein sorting-associated protein [Parasponia andersonii]|uniref:E3 ubiquitin-protein ligase listerin n=1 Tax=Parasponia andersonii TaxID=3476 RepID=A0A2P5AZ68_PARAD|nr:Vacuolar protein sorting-associated protein [Parasponia andersonii]